MAELIVRTLKSKDGKTFHTINDINIECSEKGCAICNQDIEVAFRKWETSILIPMPKKGKRYKNKTLQKHRGKLILEICYTCKKIPCYVCRRTKCKEWMREEHRKGQEQGCAHWENGRCTGFSCKKGLPIRPSWGEQ